MSAWTPTRSASVGFEEGTLGRCLDAVATPLGQAVVDLAAARRGAGLLGRRLERRPPPGPPRHLPGAVGAALRRPGSVPTRSGSGPTGPGATPPGRGSGPSCGRSPPTRCRRCALPRPAGVHRGVRGPQAGRLRPLPLPGHEPDGRAHLAGVPRRWIEPFLGRAELFFPVDLRPGAPGSGPPPRRPTLAARPTDGACRPRHGPRREPDEPGTSGDGRVRDEFDDDRLAGEVLGTRSTSGADRRGVDVEGTLAIDNHELRLATLATPGLRPPGGHLRALRAPAGPHAGGAGAQQPQHRAVEHPGRGSQGPPAAARPRPAGRRARRGTAAKSLLTSVPIPDPREMEARKVERRKASRRFGGRLGRSEAPRTGRQER